MKSESRDVIKNCEFSVVENDRSSETSKRERERERERERGREERESRRHFY